MRIQIALLGFGVLRLAQQKEIEGGGGHTWRMLVAGKGSGRRRDKGRRRSPSRRRREGRKRREERVREKGKVPLQPFKKQRVER